jgi:lysine N-acyltransferase
VVAEPDIENTPSVRAFAAAGFVQHGELQLPEKTALLMVRTRAVQGGMTCTT